MDLNQLLEGKIHLLYDLGYAGFLGFVVGFTVKRILKFFMLFLGLYFITLLYLHSKGIITINWSVLGKYLNSLLLSSEAGVKNWLNSLAFSGSFMAGLILGLKV